MLEEGHVPRADAIEPGLALVRRRSLAPDRRPPALRSIGPRRSLQLVRCEPFVHIYLGPAICGVDRCRHPRSPGYRFAADMDGRDPRSGSSIDLADFPS